MSQVRTNSTLLLLAALTVSVSFAQSFYGGLRGSVKDPNGGLVANARVILTDQTTNVARSTLTGGDGEYVFNQVVPSIYSISGEAVGFKKLQRRDIGIATQEHVALDMSLELGDVTQTVVVTEEVPLIETASASQGQVLDDQKITELPNIGRNPFILSKVAQNVIQVGNPVMN